MAEIEVRGLRKSYGDLQAVADVSFSIERGEIVALLGPNGAGKTTMVEILEGFRQRSAGDVQVLGMDPASGGTRLRRRIGIMLQSTCLDRELTVGETLDLYGSYYPRRLGTPELLQMVDLEDQGPVRIGALSGGQLRRLDFAVAIAGDPDLVFLDEPTTGFDPGARRQAWDLIRGLRQNGKTILLTTHYLDEAQTLVDRVIVLDSGRVVADADPQSLGGRNLGAAVITFHAPPGAGVEELSALPETEFVVDGGTVSLRTLTPTRTLRDLLAWADARSISELPALSVSRPTLEDAYLELIAKEED